ncbi:MAG: CPBP family intramembrane glutamic endopeptidase [Candidatus Asgardarchaeia archaeon]
MEALRNPSGVILVGIVLTLIVLIESLEIIPWSPYFLIYAALAIIIPIWLKSYKFGKLVDVFKQNLVFIVIIFVIIAVFSVAIDFIYEQLLVSSGLSGDPMYDFNAALVALAHKAAIKFGISDLNATLIYAVYIIVWAPIGEELFYRGYMYGELKQRMNKYAAMLISTFFFGIRHATHFFFLLPEYPLIPGIYWAVHAFIFGLIIVYLYEKTDSLYPPMIIHFLANVLF